MPKIKIYSNSEKKNERKLFCSLPLQKLVVVGLNPLNTLFALDAGLTFQSKAVKLRLSFLLPSPPADLAWLVWSGFILPSKSQVCLIIPDKGTQHRVAFIIQKMYSLPHTVFKIFSSASGKEKPPDPFRIRDSNFAVF